MGIGKGLTVASALLCLTTACDFGGGSSDRNRSGRLPKQPETEVLTILTQWPQDQAENVPTSASIAIQFDAALHNDCLRDGRTYLEERDTGTRIATELTLNSQESTLRLRPTSALAIETWYTCHLSPLLCDNDERLLEEDLYFSFRTVDTTAPTHTSVSIDDGATNVNRDLVICFAFAENIDRLSVTSETVYLRDNSGKDHPVRLLVLGNQICIYTVRDLLPNTIYTITVLGGPNGVRDMASNPLTSTIARTFTTAPDSQAPTLLKIDPEGPQVSADAHMLLYFDEAVDLDSVETSAIDWKDEFGNFVLYDVVAEASHRILRLAPKSALVVGRNYTLTVNKGVGAITDLAGNVLGNEKSVSLIGNADRSAPKLSSATPTHNSQRVSHNVRPYFVFDETLDPTRVNETAISLTDENGELTFVAALSAGNTRIEVIPTTPLKSGQKYTVTFHAGALGLRDLYGNTLATDLVTSFFTSTDNTLPVVTTSPTHGHSAVSPNSTVTASFEDPLEPSSVNLATVIVTDQAHRVVDGTVSLSAGNRIITFTPSRDYASGDWHTLTLRDGPSGVRESSGNWLTQPLTVSFRAAYSTDSTPPTVTISINDTAARRKKNLTVPSSGFEITVRAEDPINYDVDLGSFEVMLSGNGNTLDAETIVGGATLSKDGLRFVVPLNQKLPAGEYEIYARVADMAGNEGQSEHLTFTVVDYDASKMPFERTQVVWVRFDLDRDGNGQSDFEDDLQRLGFITSGDPAGTNQLMIDEVREGTLAQAHLVYERKANGGRKDRSSMALLFTDVRPYGVTYSEIAFGGLDPNSTPGRGYGDKSSGVLGRAYYDQYNSDRGDINTATSPGLGVFGGELFLFEVETHIQVGSLFLTTFARRFIKLCPQMGGTSVGSGHLDTKVLTTGFNPYTAPANEMARFFQIWLAADDWATATGVVLAHETAHTVGLVATGSNPTGLHGDNSLHNKRPDLGDVMASGVGYDSLVHLPYRFRDLNAAYLRQRIIMK